MQLHELKPKHPSRKSRRVGRGGKRGTYSGRGIKGQLARAGRKKVPVIRELIKRYPKLRGYRSKTFFKRKAVLNLDSLDKNFESGKLVTPQLVVEKKLVRKMGGKIPSIKILGKGEITKALKLEGFEVSKSAREKIKKAGGEVNA